MLACNTVFHRDHVLRRYRAAIERAAGAACEVVVRPAQPERHQGGPPASGLGPGPGIAAPCAGSRPGAGPPAPATPVGR